MNVKQEFIAGCGVGLYLIFSIFTLLSALQIGVGLLRLPSLLQSPVQTASYFSYDPNDVMLGVIVNKTDDALGCLIDYTPEKVVFVGDTAYIGVNTSLYVPAAVICSNLRVGECMYANKNPPKFYSHECSGVVVSVGDPLQSSTSSTSTSIVYNHRQSSTTATTASTSTSSTTSTTFRLAHQGSWSGHHPTSSSTSSTLAVIYDFYLNCVNDTQCGLAEDCCSCGAGGHYFAMNKVYIESWERANACPTSVHCLGSMKPCENYRSVCVNGSCGKVLV